MKIISKNLSLIILVLLIAIVCFAAVKLQALPVAILKSVGITELEAQQTAQSIAYEYYLPLVGALFLVVLLVLSALWRRYGNAEDQIIYVERTQNEESQQEESKEQHEGNIQAKVDKLKYWFTHDAAQLESESKVKEKLFAKICNELEAVSAAFYRCGNSDGREVATFETGYAFHIPKSQKVHFEKGEGLIGQVFKSGKTLSVKNVPDDHIKVFSGLGETKPNHLTIVPTHSEEGLMAIIEIATFKPIPDHKLTFLQEAAPLMVNGMSAQTTSVDTEAQ